MSAIIVSALDSHGVKELGQAETVKAESKNLVVSLALSSPFTYVL